jgi:hypothetical protein
MPSLGQGHGKKRHLHAQSARFLADKRIVSFMYNPEAKRRGHLLLTFHSFKEGLDPGACLLLGKYTGIGNVCLYNYRRYP